MDSGLRGFLGFRNVGWFGLCSLKLEDVNIRHNFACTRGAVLDRFAVTSRT